MKSLKKAAMMASAKAAKATAEMASGSASMFICHQPKEPAKLKKASK